MADKDIRNTGGAGNGTWEDEALEQMLRGAYDAMGPAPEQEERMLAALIEAQESKGRQAGEELSGAAAAEAEKPSDAAGGKAASGDAVASQAPSPKQARRAKPWMIALPLAACLAVGAVVVGIGNAGPRAALEESPVASGAAPAVSQSAEAEPNADGGAQVATEELKGEIAYESAIEEDAVAAGAIDGGTRLNAMAATSDADGYWPGDVAGDVEFDTEEYDSVEERGFVSTKTSPLSTVSADVDTASYCNVRRMINDGAALSDIPAGAVRIEEMLNYFRYDYAAPEGDDLFSMQAQASACPWNEDTQLLVMGFATRQETKVADKGSNLVFLVDVSGSMDSPDKLDLLQDSFATLADHLDGDDRVSIVTYANGEDIVLEGARGDDSREIMRAVYKLRADGATNGEAGLKQAYEVARRNFIEGGVNRIVMASDGDLNVGMTSESELHDFVDAQRESGIYLSVLGFGTGNYKDNKMETLADHGNGSYHYIDCIEEAERVLSDNLTANLVPFVDDVKVQVEFNPAQVKGYRLIGYDNRMLADEDFRDDAVDAGDVGPNAQFTVAYEIVPADSPFEVAESELKYGSGGASYDNGNGDWLTCTMRYHVFDGDEMREQELVVTPAASSDAPSEDWNFAAAVIEFGMLARDSKYAGTSSADSIMELLAGGSSGSDRAEFRKLVAKAS